MYLLVEEHFFQPACLCIHDSTDLRIHCLAGETAGNAEMRIRMNVVLLEPEIPANTGNIGRTCVATNTKLHLIEPMGFRLNEKQIRRAGLDYWKHLDVTVYDSYQDFLDKNPNAKIYMATTKARMCYTKAAYEPDCFLMFGKESAGIPEEYLLQNKENTIRIPMMGDIRSLNLGNSVAIVLYEALRQNGFAGMNLAGELHHHSWEEA
jgi:tRNA (cytidine/uridine-2'-O-)-methyltransferase